MRWSELNKPGLKQPAELNKPGLKQPAELNKPGELQGQTGEPKQPKLHMSKTSLTTPKPTGQTKTAQDPSTKPKQTSDWIITPDIQPTPAEFLRAVFAPFIAGSRLSQTPDADQTQETLHDQPKTSQKQPAHILITYRQKLPKGDFGYPMEPFKPDFTDVLLNHKLPKGERTQFAISVHNHTLKDKTKEDTVFNRKYNRDIDTFAGGCVVMIDDINQIEGIWRCGKYETPKPAIPVKPSVILGTSPGNHQFLYILAEPVTNKDEFTFITKAVAKKYGDASAGQAVNLARLPGSVKTKSNPFETKVIHWEPTLVHKITDLINGLQIDPMEGNVRPAEIPYGVYPLVRSLPPTPGFLSNNDRGAHSAFYHMVKLGYLPMTTNEKGKPVVNQELAYNEEYNGVNFISPFEHSSEFQIGELYGVSPGYNKNPEFNDKFVVHGWRDNKYKDTSEFLSWLRKQPDPKGLKWTDSVVYDQSSRVKQSLAMFRPVPGTNSWDDFDTALDSKGEMVMKNNIHNIRQALALLRITPTIDIASGDLHLGASKENMFTYIGQKERLQVIEDYLVDLGIKRERTSLKQIIEEIASENTRHHFHSLGALMKMAYDNLTEKERQSTNYIDEYHDRLIYETKEEANTSRHFFQKWCMQLVQACCAWNERKQLRLVYIIVSQKENIGKSLFFKYLVPEDYVNGDVIIEKKIFDPDNLMEKMLGGTITVFDELEASLTRENAPVFKNLLSGTMDNRREKFKAREKRPRTTIFAGTSNKETDLLYDEAGTSRFSIHILKDIVQIPLETQEQISKFKDNQMRRLGQMYANWLANRQDPTKGISFALTAADVDQLGQKNQEYKSFDDQNDFLEDWFEWLTTQDGEELPEGLMRMRQDIMPSLTHFRAVGNNGGSFDFGQYMEMPNEKELKKFLLTKRVRPRVQGQIPLKNGSYKTTTKAWKIPGADRYHLHYTEE